MKKVAIKGFENYSITIDGMVLNENKPLKIQMTKQGTPFVRLRKDKEYFTFSIAKLVGLTYLGEPLYPSDIIGYKDGNNHNFHKDNLYWTSRSDAYSKMYDKSNRYSEERIRKLRKTICKPVMSCKKTSQGLIEVKNYESITEAAKDMKVSSASIIRCLKNQNNTCMGLTWLYINKEEK